ncbi:MAG: 3'-5' exonuclease [Cyclobacteriaceae bacterium]|nr:3'-5' exonuclease [Cyclobacteriaceae bacterium]
MDANLENIVFLDIETVSVQPKYLDLSERIRKQWNRKAKYIHTDELTTPEALFEQRAAIYAEFGKVVAIAIGFYHLKEGGTRGFRVKALTNDDEATLLRMFNDYLGRFNAATLQLCAHNGKEFDFPYLCRRMLVNGISLPAVLDISGKKPWEVSLLDTMEMWKFGDWKHYTSLDLLAALFDVPSSKDTMDGSQVGEVYYQEQDLAKIGKYCAQDVVVTAQVFLKFKGLPLIEKENISIL